MKTLTYPQLAKVLLANNYIIVRNKFGEVHPINCKLAIYHAKENLLRKGKSRVVSYRIVNIVEYIHFKNQSTFSCTEKS